MATDLEQAAVTPSAILGTTGSWAVRGLPAWTLAGANVRVRCARVRGRDERVERGERDQCSYL